MLRKKVPVQFFAAKWICCFWGFSTFAVIASGHREFVFNPALFPLAEGTQSVTAEKF